MHSYHNHIHSITSVHFPDPQTSPKSASSNSPRLCLLSQPLSDYLEAIQFNNQGLYEKAIHHLLTAFQTVTRESNGKTSYLAIKVLIELSRAKLGLADFKQAEEYLNEALEAVTQSTSITVIERESFYGEIELAHGDIDMEKYLFDSALSNFNKSLATFETLNQEKSLILAGCYRRIGEALLEQKFYFDALDYYERALSAINKREEDLNNEEYLEIIKILNRKGLLFANLQRYKEATEMLVDCSIAIKSRFGPEHIELIWTYHHLGAIYLRLCLYSKAKEALENALALEKKLFGEKCHPWIARTYAEIGRLLTDQEKLDEGEAAFLRALKFARELYGNEEYPALGLYYLKLGYFYLEQEKYEEAERVFTQVLEIYTKTYGEHNGLTAIGYHTLAVTYQEMGKEKEARECYCKDLEICRSYYGEVHPEVSKSYYWLGILSWMKEKKEESIDYLKKCSEIDERYYGKGSPQIAIDYQELGRMMMESENSEESQRYYRKSSEIEENYFGEKHPRVARSYFLIGIGLCDAGKWKEAKQMLEKSLNVIDKNDKEGEFQVRRIYHALGNLYNNKGKYKEALKYYGKALRIQTSSASNEELLRNLADVFYNQDKFEKALELYKTVLDLTIKNKGSKHYTVGILHTNIGNCLGWMRDQEVDAMKSLHQGIKILNQTPFKENKDQVVLLDNFYSRGDVQKRTKGARESILDMKKAMVLCRMSERDKVKDLDNSIRDLEKSSTLISNNFLSENI